MYHGKKIAAIAPAYNELGKIEEVAAGLAALDFLDLPIVVDDGSTDGGGEAAERAGATVLRHAARRGIGASIRTGIDYAREHGADIIVIIAGNGKDDPQQIPRLLDPIVRDGCHYVQGSRYLEGGEHGRMPLHRAIGTRLYPWMMRLLVGHRCTEVTNGFRAYKATIFEDLGIDIWQERLDGYELELFLHIKAVTRGKTAEVPVSKVYPAEQKPGGYTKIRFVRDWWPILKPLFDHTLGLDGAPSPPRAPSLGVSLLVFLLALAVLVGAHAAMGLSLHQDNWSTMLWGRELASGTPMNHASFTAPKILPILIAAAGQWVPGGQGPEWFFAVAAALSGAGVVLLTSRLAWRIGGALAGLAAVPLVLGHMQFIRYVANGQSTIYASLFILGALLLATREEVGARECLWAAVLVFAAAMCRPETVAVGGALAVALWLRLGWRRVGWPAVVIAIAVASVGVNLAFYKVAFGSASYTSDLAREDTLLGTFAMPGLTIGFAVRVAKTIFFYANRSWVLLLLAGVGLGLVVQTVRRPRYAAVVLFPLATASFAWLLVARGVLFNERGFYYVTFIIVALAAAAIGRLSVWAATSREFLAGVTAPLRAAAFAAVALAFVAPVYASRPVPRQGWHNAKLEAGFAFLAEQIQDRDKPPRIVVSDDMSQLFYRLRLPADRCCVSALRLIRGGDGTLPDDVEWGVIDEKSKPVDFPPEWGLREVWADKTGDVRVYRRQPPTPEEAGSLPE